MAGAQRGRDDRLPMSLRPRPRILRCLVITVLSLIVLVGLAILIFWLVVRPSTIEFTVDKASVRGFNITNHALNATFDLTIHSYNGNRRISVYYDSILVTVSYDDQQVAFQELAPFYQPRRGAKKLDVSAPARLMPLQKPVERNLKHDRSAGAVGLEVRVRAKIRLKIGAVKTKHYTLKAYCSPVLVRFSSPANFDKVYCDVDI